MAVSRCWAQGAEEDVYNTVEEATKFIACGGFKGAKEGFTFTTGEQGTGYYLDQGPFVERADGIKGEKTLLMTLGERKAEVVAALGIGVAVPFGLKALKKATPTAKAPASPFFSSPPSGPSKPPSAAGSGPSMKSAAPVESATSAPVSGKDPAAMRASELKKAIADMGGSTVGIMEKSELVALYTELQKAPRQSETRRYNPSAGMGEELDFSGVPDMSNINPNVSIVSASRALRLPPSIGAPNGAPHRRRCSDSTCRYVGAGFGSPDGGRDDEESDDAQPAEPDDERS